MSPPLDLLVVALTLQLLDGLSAKALLSLTLFLKDFDGFVEGLNGCALHLKLLEEGDEQRPVTPSVFSVQCLILPSTFHLLFLFFKLMIKTGSFGPTWEQNIDSY